MHKRKELYSIYFVENNTNIIGKNMRKKIFVNGKAKLNTNECEYLFGLSCIHCSCQNCDGYEFKVSFSTNQWLKVLINYI